MTDLLAGTAFEAVWDLGWTLIHFLWQGILLAALLNAILPLCRSANARLNWALAILAMMALAPIATFLSLHDVAERSGTILRGGSADLFAPALIPPAWIDALVGLWLIGIAALSLRALGGWTIARSLRRGDTLAVPPALLQRCHQLQRRLAVTWPVHFLLSRRVNVPMVIGCLRPVILIPVSAISGLAPDQLDALILHELAHIRRLDMLTNILLIAVETILFYHPAVWWVSRQIRIEREHCCDDLAVSACGDAALYAEALTLLETWKAPAGLALSANGGRLKRRVARLLEAPAQARRFSLSGVAGLALVSLVVASLAIAAPSSHRKTARTTELQPIRETHTLPPYPKESIHLKEEGRVLLGVTIGTDGAVSRARVVQASGHQRLDAAATEFVKDHWRWQPATRAGKPVVASTRVSVLFKLAPRAAQSR